MVFKKRKDHWAFLDEIEAPVWVDLTQEDAKYNSQYSDDEWFHTSHLFHQCSSRQLKAAFSCSGEGSYDSDFELLGPSSPKLPASVSRSRGKDYKSKKRRGGNCDVLLNKLHSAKVLSQKSTADVKKIKSNSSFAKPKSARVDTKSCEELKPKLSFIKSEGTSSSNQSFVCDGSSTQNAKGHTSKSISSSRGLESNSCSVFDNTNESNTHGTVTSESSLLGQQSIIELSSRAFGHSSMLLSAVRITLRKSGVPRQASRVETNNDKSQSKVGFNNDRWESTIDLNSDRRESRGRKSSSSKSSVGSSSVPSDAKSSRFVSTRKKEKTPDSRSLARMTNAPSNKGKVYNVSKGSIVPNNKGNFNSRRENITTTTDSTFKEATKLKVQSHTLGAKSSALLRVNKQNSVIGAVNTRGKVGSSDRHRLVAVGKENALGKMSNVLKCSGRENATGLVVRDQNKKQQNVQQRGLTRLLNSQQGKVSDRSEGKNSVCVNQRVYLR